ncbi:MAG: hypothetical protein QF473_29955 [Planctomycetota bacterium]|nr:hypothetical protein [Planctomycetota bacterium]
MTKTENRLRHLFDEVERDEDVQCGTTEAFPSVFPAWESELHKAMTQAAEVFASAWDVSVRMATIERKVSKWEEDAKSTSTSISTFAPLQIGVKRPVPVSIMFNEPDYIATFFEANINASGDTPQGAFWGLREVVAARFLRLTELNPSVLGKTPARQLHILNEFLELKDE